MTEKFDATVGVNVLPGPGVDRALSLALSYQQVESFVRTGIYDDSHGWRVSLELDAYDFLRWFGAHPEGFIPSATEARARMLSQTVMNNIEKVEPGNATSKHLLGGLALEQGDDLLRALQWEGLSIPSVEAWYKPNQDEIKEADKWR